MGQEAYEMHGLGSHMTEKGNNKIRGVRMKRAGMIASASAIAVALTSVVALSVHTSAGAAESRRPSGPAPLRTPEPGQTSTPDPSLPAPKVNMDLVREAEDSGKVVAITIDDGPDPRWTPKALELLAKYDVKATFCVTGPNAKARPDLIRKIVAAGHRLCDHSVTHDVAMDKKSVEYQSKEILDAKKMIDEASGNEKIWYYRAPGGAFTPASRQIAAAYGMRSLGWSVDPSDYKRPGTQSIVRSVKEQLPNGPTVLLHDGGGDRSQSMEALEQLLPWFKQEGYGFSFPKA